MGKVIYVNDSKATNADATARALSSYRNIYWILGGQAKEGGVAPLEPYFDRIRHAFLIGEATELFAGQLEGKLPFDRCGDLQSALERRARARAGRGDRRRRWCCCRRPAPRGTSGSSYEHRGDAFREMARALPGAETRGESGMIQVPRDDRSLIGQWWWTVDRWALGAVLAIMAFGVMLTLAASPPAAERIGADSFMFAKRQFIFLPMALALMLGDLARLAAACAAAGAAGVLRQPRAAGRDLRDRRRDQGRAALDLGARPVERAAIGIREAEPRRDLRPGCWRRAAPSGGCQAISCRPCWSEWCWS